MSELEIPPGFENLGWTAVAAWGAQKVFGGSIQAISDELGAFTRVKIRNALGVLERIGKRTSEEPADQDPGSVPERLALQIVDQAAMLSDPLMQEYLAGVAVSSRTHDDSDDRGISLSSQLGRLSSVQIRTHYVLYRIMHDSMTANPVPPEDDPLRRRPFVVMTPDAYSGALDLPIDRFDEIATHAATGLDRESLLEVSTINAPLGSTRYSFVDWPDVDRDDVIGVLAGGTPSGLELFMWANGVQSSSTSRFVGSPLDSQLASIVTMPADGYGIVHMHESYPMHIDTDGVPFVPSPDP